MAGEVQVSEIMQSNAILRRAPVGTALPAASLALNGDWPAGWDRVGLTNSPLTLAYKFEVVEAEVEEFTAPVARRRIKESVELETTLAQGANLELLALATSGNHSEVEPGVGTVGYEDFDIGGEQALDHYIYGYEGQWIDTDGTTYPVRAFTGPATAIEGATLTYAKKEYTGIPLKVSSLADTSKAAGQQLLKVRRVTAPAE